MTQGKGNKKSPKEILKEYFGYSSFKPLQEDAINSVLDGKDTFVLLPTGGGKSVCFQIPAIMLPGCTLVVSPLISLMSDQVLDLTLQGIPAAKLNSTLNENEKRDVLSLLSLGKIKMLYMAPETLFSQMGQYVLKHFPISLFAIDEAHCISQWGHDFRPEYGQLSALREKMPSVPIIALTATADAATRRDIIEKLKLNQPTCLIGDFDRPNISLMVYRGYKKADKLIAIRQHIEMQDGFTSGIIYCNKRSDTEMVARELNEVGIRSLPYHAGLPAKSRETVHDLFLKNKISAVCATVAFGMGIDKPDVRWVVHYNMPKNIESYYQEIGRAGRDGLPATALLFYSYADIFVLDKLIAESGQFLLNKHKMDYMKRFCEASICRRKILLSYFDQPYPQKCNNCDVCLNPPKNLVNATVYIQKALSTIIRAREQIGIDMVIEILRGSRRIELLAHRYNTLTTYGIGLELSYLEWKDYIYQMVQTGLLRIDYTEGYVLKVTEAGYQALKGEKPYFLVKFEIPKYKRSYSKRRH